MITVISVNGISVVALGGNVLIDDVDILEAKLNDAFDNGSRKYIVDFSDTDYICSYGLGVIAQLLKKVFEQGGVVRFCAVGGKLKGVFETMQFTSIVGIDATRDASFAEMK
ncbi:MAG: STAS domain-containing protein [Spirochaetota bacterium]